MFDKGPFSEKALYSLVKKNMRKLRKKHKLTQAEVAQKLGITVQHYQQIESGKTPPNLRIVSKMCEVFGVHPSYFFSEADLSVIDKDGQVLAEDLSTNDLLILRSSSGLSPEAQESVLEYIRFKYFEANEKQNKNQKLNK